MSMKQIVGSSRSRWCRLFDDSTATTALAVPLPSNTVPTGTGLLSTGEFPLARFIISGTVATGTINYQIIGWQRFTQTGGTGAPTAWIPRVLASGVATLGTAAVTATWIGTATDVFAHTITETTGATGSVIFSPGGNKIAWIEVDCSNCELLEVETDLETATAASVIYQLGDRVGGLMDIDASIAGTGLATSALQTTGNTSLGTIKTNTDVLVAAGGGGYIRQDSTATLAKESGGNLASVKTNTDKIPALGTAAMAASAPVTLATDDTQTGAVGAASDVDGNLHGQLRYIGEAVDNLPAAVGSGAMAASMPVTIATDDTQFAKLTGSAMTYGDAVVNAAADAQTAIVAAPGAGKQIWVMGYDVSAGVAAGTWHWESANTDKYTAKEVGVNGGSVRQSSNPQSPLFKCGTNEALNITTVTCTIKGGVSYFVVTV